MAVWLTRLTAHLTEGDEAGICTLDSPLCSFYRRPNSLSGIGLQG
jgi:hypothetical protein